MAKYSASISELKKSPTELIKNAGNEAVEILNHNVTSAYLVPSALYENMMDIIEDYQLSTDVKEALKYNKEDLIEVNIK